MKGFSPLDLGKPLEEEEDPLPPDAGNNGESELFEQPKNKAAARTDMGIAGVTLPDNLDAICSRAVVTYCKLHFGEPDEYDRLKASYDEQKAQLSMATGYTTWTEATLSS